MICPGLFSAKVEYEPPENSEYVARTKDMEVSESVNRALQFIVNELDHTGD